MSSGLRTPAPPTGASPDRSRTAPALPASRCQQDVGRADLLRLLELGLDRETAAALTGFDWVEPGSEPPSPQLNGPNIPSEGQVFPPTVSVSAPGVQLWRLSNLQIAGPDAAASAEPAWVTAAASITEEQLGAQPQHAAPPQKPLLRDSRLAPVLRRLVGELQPSRQLDAAALVRSLARCKPLRRLPRKTRFAYAPRLQLYWDLSAVTQPCFQDQLQVSKWLRRWRGGQGLEECVVDETGQAQWLSYVHGRYSPRRDSARPAAPHTTVLVLGDLGFVRADATRQALWRRLALIARRRRARCASLTLSPRSRFEPSLARLWNATPWEGSGARAHLNGSLQDAATDALQEAAADSDNGAAPDSTQRAALESTNGAAPDPFLDSPAPPGAALATRLLTLLAPAIRIEPALLRDVRLLLAPHGADLGTELDAWMDERVRGRSTAGMALHPERAVELRQASARQPAALQRALVKLLRHHHAALAPGILAEELVATGEPELAAEGQLLLASHVKRIRQRGELSGPAERAYLRRFEGRQSEEAWRSDVAAGLWAVAHQTEQGFDAPLPVGMELRQVLWILGADLPQRSQAQLRQCGAELKFERVGAEEEPGRPGCVLATLPLRVPQLEVSSFFPDGEPLRKRLNLGQSIALAPEVQEQSGTAALPLRIELSTDLASATLQPQPCPAAAQALERDADGLWFLAQLPWCGLQRIAWPTWVTEMQWDEYGPLAVLELPTDAAPAGQGSAPAALHFRFIPAGDFLMGSPPTEEGRWDDEGRQHKVTLTRGYWLADVPCTQAQWQAVMGTNPSHFQDEAVRGATERRPVEQVSWEDCRRFCAQLNQRFPELDARLPSEAEWENACRAGSSAALNDGSGCTVPEGNDPALDALGWYGENAEGRTHAVRGKKANAAGLWDMHGNVLEWCADAWQSDYQAAEAVDPLPHAADSEAPQRVVRGGSWRNTARRCRSAFRIRFAPSHRISLLGFRLATGQGVRPVQAGGGPGGQVAGGRRPAGEAEPE